MAAGENDTAKDAGQLAALLKGFPCHVNLIPINPVKERGYRRTDKNSVENFKLLLEKNAIDVTIRRGMGRDIDAACGQLRKAYMDENS